MHVGKIVTAESMEKTKATTVKFFTEIRLQQRTQMYLNERIHLNSEARQTRLRKKVHSNLKVLAQARRNINGKSNELSDASTANTAPTTNSFPRPT